MSIQEEQQWIDHRITDFTRGYIDKIDDNELPVGALLDCRNVISRQIGKITSRKGQVLLNEDELTTDGGIQGLSAFYVDTEKYLLTAANGNLYYCNPPSGEMTLLKSGLDANAPVMFVTAYVDGKNQIMGFNGVDTPFKWDGVGSAEDLQDYRIVSREEPDSANYVDYALNNKPIRPGSSKFFVYSNNSLLEYEDGYSLDAENGVITFSDPRINVVDDLNDDEAQTVCYPLNGLIECLHPFLPGEEVKLYDNKGNLVYTFVDETIHNEKDGTYRADYANGLLYVPTEFEPYDVFVENEVLTTGINFFYRAGKPFQNNIVPIVKAHDSTVLNPTFISHSAGIVGFKSSQLDNEPLTISYSYTEVVGGALERNVDHKIYEAQYPFQTGKVPIVRDKDGHVIFPDTVSYSMGWIYFDKSQEAKEPLTADYISSMPISVTNAPLTVANNICYFAAKPFKKGLVPTIRDKFGNVSSPEYIDFDNGMLQFAVSQAANEPLKASYTWVNGATAGSLGLMMPLKVKYKWADSIKVDYEYSTGSIASELRYPIMWKGRIFAMAGDDYIYWSDITENGSEYEAWPPVNNWPINQGKGESDGCLIVLHNELYIFKNRSIHRFRGNSLEDYVLSPVTGSVGCAGPLAADLASDSEVIYFISEEGLYQFDGLNAQNISRGHIPMLWGTVNLPALNQAVVKSWHGLVLFALPVNKSTVNNLLLAYDPMTSSFWIWDNIEVSCYAEISTTSGINLYAGSATGGYVTQQDTGYSDFGENIKSMLRLPSLDAGAADRLKKSRYVYVEHGADQNEWVEVYAGKDKEEMALLPAISLNKGMRKYALRPKITGKWRYMDIEIRHENEGPLSVKSVMMPFKIKEKTSVKGEP